MNSWGRISVVFSLILSWGRAQERLIATFLRQDSTLHHGQTYIRLQKNFQCMVQIPHVRVMFAHIEYPRSGEENFEYGLKEPMSLSIAYWQTSSAPRNSCLRIHNFVWAITSPIENTKMKIVMEFPLFGETAYCHSAKIHSQWKKLPTDLFLMLTA